MSQAVRLNPVEPTLTPPDNPGPVSVRQLLYLPGFTPQPARKLSFIGRFLVWLGDRPNIVIATVVHVVLFVGLFSLVMQEKREQQQVKAIEIAISMEEAFDENTEDEPDASSGSEAQIARPVPVAGTANDADAAANTGGVSAAPEPKDWQAPTETGGARVTAQQPMTGNTGGGEGVPGRGDTGAGSTSAGYSMRDATGRAAGVATNGGTAASEDAVNAGLKWLAAHIHLKDHRDSSSGHIIRLGWWRPSEFPKDARDLETGERVTYPGRWPSGEVGMDRYAVGVTALCTMAFQGAGNTPDNNGTYAYIVAATMNWLLREQDRYGSFDKAEMYNHAIATTAVAECMVMTKNEALRRPLERAVQYLLNTQHKNGGWDYTHNPAAARNDTSITGWCQMALKAAYSAGIAVPRTAWLKLIHHFRRMSTQDGYTWYADLDGDDDFRQGNAMVATSIFCRLGLGVTPDDQLMRKQMSILLSELPDSERIRAGSSGRRRTSSERLDQSYYTWYIGTLATFFHGGEEWNRWNAVMRETAVSMQNEHGQLRGSWDGLDKWSWAGGRLYATAMMVLTLETYYRYVPDYFIADARRLESFHDPRKLYQILGTARQNDRVQPRER